LLLLTVLFLTEVSSRTAGLYPKNGVDWPGICSIGKYQSPINIIDGKNTVDDTSVLSFDYKVPKDGIYKKFLFDGERAYMDIDIGNMAFFNKAGANEVYRAYRIEIHFPSEHYVTMFNQTPRYPLELQIFHSYVASSKAEITHKQMKVNKAVVSILFTQGPVSDGEEFLEQLGFSKYNRDGSEYLTSNAKDTIQQNNVRVGLYDTGFNVKALQGLLNAINADPHIYRYYGSETTPPCREEVLWFVFARPRSISTHQFKFLKKQLAKSKKNSTPVKDAKHFLELYGNKRKLQNYDDNVRGKIYSNRQGIRQVKRHNFFKSKKKLD